MFRHDSASNQKALYDNISVYRKEIGLLRVNTAELAHQPHNHQRCIVSALQSAQEVCSRNAVKFTQLRKQVFELIWRSHQPLGAYRIMELLAESTTRRVAPPTVYRALEFLQEQGLVHKINSLNAFIGCPHPGHTHESCFLLCKACGNAMECDQTDILNAINRTAHASQFAMQTAAIEIVGLCQKCQSQGNNA